MKLWLIEQDENNNYDTYDSAVVAADSESDARAISPDGGKWRDRHSSWASSPDNVKVSYVGEAAPGLVSGEIICASFNAG